MLAPFAAVRHRPGPFAISLGSPDPDRDPTPRRPGEYGAPNPGQNAPLEQGFGMCSVIVRETGEYAGWVTLAVPAFLPAILPAVEIGWRLRRMHWGQGYATEAAAELLRFGLTGAGLDRVVSIRDIDNARSARVMDKLGLRFEFQTTVPATGQPVAVHAIARQEPGVRDGSDAN